jgi:hypothetical protein
MKIESHPNPAPSTRSSPVDVTKSIQGHPTTPFEAVLGKREIRTRRSLRAEVEKLSSGASVNAELFGSTRSLELLDYILQQVLPSLDTDDQTRAVAATLILEEIEMRRSLEQQRAEVQG